MRECKDLRETEGKSDTVKHGDKSTKESVEASAKKRKPLSKTKKTVAVQKQARVTGDNSGEIKTEANSEGIDQPKRSDLSKSNKVDEGRKRAKEKDGKGGKVEPAESAEHVSIRFDQTTQNSDSKHDKGNS